MTRTTDSRPGLAIGALLLAAGAGTAAQAQEPASTNAPAGVAAAQAELDRTPEDCVLLNRIARKVGVNDRQVVFFMRGDTYYLNVLDGACQSLTAGETRLVFHAKNTGSARIARLCDTDSFTVERQTSRIGCSLGMFNPITAEEAAALTGQPIPAAAASSSSSGERSERTERSERSSRRDRD
jgi:hypothetical protein